MLKLLTRWARPRSQADLSHLRVTVFTRRQCCCCHTAVELLEEFGSRHGFAIEQVDVDSEPELAERHGMFVPVVAIGGKVRFRGVVNPVLLDRLLLGEVRSR